MGWFKNTFKTVARIGAGIATGGLSEVALAAKRRADKKRAQQRAKNEEAKKLAAGDPDAQRRAMKKDVGEGRKFGKDILGEGLGRVDAGRSDEMKDVMSRRKKGMEGMDPAEQEAFRSKMLKQMQGAEQRQGLLLGAQLGGARGAGAAAQMRSLQQSGMSKRADMETDLFLKNSTSFS